MKKTVVPGIYKVSEGVLVNRDNEALEKYKKRKQRLQQQDNKINNLEQKVDVLVQDMNEIKTLLKKLTER